MLRWGLPLAALVWSRLAGSWFCCSWAVEGGFAGVVIPVPINGSWIFLVSVAFLVHLHGPHIGPIDPGSAVVEAAGYDDFPAEDAPVLLPGFDSIE